METTWTDKLNQWKQGMPQKYPLGIGDRFFYETTKCVVGGHSVYKSVYVPHYRLNSMAEDWGSFSDKFAKTDAKYVTSFLNLSGDAMLVVPIPRGCRNFTTMKEFVDNGSEAQQEAFWKYVAECVEYMHAHYGDVYISTHGLGVPFFHLRICTRPKYYQSNLA